MTSRPRFTPARAHAVRKVLTRLSQGEPKNSSFFQAFLDRWKKDYCVALGHPLELREGYMTTCMCGERFGAVSEEQAAEIERNG